MTRVGSPPVCESMNATGEREKFEGMGMEIVAMEMKADVESDHDFARRIWTKARACSLV